jgi:hypothetical protein
VSAGIWRAPCRQLTGEERIPPAHHSRMRAWVLGALDRATCSSPYTGPLPTCTGALTQLLPGGLRLAIEETNHLGSAQAALPLCGGSGDLGPYLADAPDARVRKDGSPPRQVESRPAVIEQGHFGPNSAGSCLAAGVAACRPGHASGAPVIPSDYTARWSASRWSIAGMARAGAVGKAAVT